MQSNNSVMCSPTYTVIQVTVYHEKYKFCIDIFTMAQNLKGLGDGALNITISEWNVMIIIL